MTKKIDAKGFANAAIIITLVVIIVALGSWYILHNKNNSSNNNASSNSGKSDKTSASQQSEKTKKDTADSTRYLVISEWGVKVPLDSSLSDAYYVVSTSSHDADGKPGAVWLGLKSLDGTGGCVASNTSAGYPFSALIRALPSDKDPVSGDLYTQKYSNGTTINGYYYAYTSYNPQNPCTSDPSYQTKLKEVDLAFKAAALKIVAN